MSPIFFVLILILVGIVLIKFYNKLPHPVITFIIVFVMMCIIYGLPYIVDLCQYPGHKKVKSVLGRHPFMEHPVSSETSQEETRS